jgi:nuclear transport factor 2 (NTF2) superfamily protein
MNTSLLRPCLSASKNAIRSMSVQTAPSKLVPPFTNETAHAKVKAAQNLWNTQDPEKIALAYTEGALLSLCIYLTHQLTRVEPTDSIWRNRTSFVRGRPEIVELLKAKWAKEKEYMLRKELFAFTDNRVAVQFWYEYQDATDGMKWKRCCESTWAMYLLFETDLFVRRIGGLDVC